MTRAALTLGLLGVLATGCGEDKKKPFWDWKQAFGTPVVEMASFVPFIDETGVEQQPAWRYEVVDFARTRIERIAKNAKDEYEQRYAKKGDATSPAALTGEAFVAIGSACKVKIALTTEERARRDAAGIAGCKRELLKLDAALDGWAREASGLGLPAGTVLRLTTEPPMPTGPSEVAGLKKLLERGPKEAAWQAARVDPSATPEALKQACAEAELEIGSQAAFFPASLQSLVESRAHFAKGRKLMLMHASHMSDMELDSLGKLRDRERDQTCAALRELATSHEVPVVYSVKIATLVEPCPPPRATPEPAPSPSASTAPSASPSAMPSSGAERRRP